MWFGWVGLERICESERDRERRKGGREEERKMKESEREDMLSEVEVPALSLNLDGRVCSSLDAPPPPPPPPPYPPLPFLDTVKACSPSLLSASASHFLPSLGFGFPPSSFSLQPPTTARYALSTADGRALSRLQSPRSMVRSVPPTTAVESLWLLSGRRRRSCAWISASRSAVCVMSQRWN